MIFRSIVLSLLAVILDSSVVNAQPPGGSNTARRRIVEIEVSSSNNAPLETQQKWMEVLSAVGADRLRSRSSLSGTASPSVSESETPHAVIVKVQGVMDGQRLVLPGKSFSIKDSAAIQEYVRQLREDGAQIALAEKKAFGLTSQQLVEVNEQLSTVLEIETKALASSQLVDHVRTILAIPVEVDASAKFPIKGHEPILDELSGLSCGTALAAALRPLGLVVTPQRKMGESTRLWIMDFRQVDEHWPIGWPSDKIPKQLMPEMFSQQPIEIRGFGLDLVLQAVQVRTKVPMLLDHNSLARAGIDLSQSKVTFEKERSSYMHALGKILNQTRPRLGYELRMDENDKAFLWISTANPQRSR